MQEQKESVQWQDLGDLQNASGHWRQALQALLLDVITATFTSANREMDLSAWLKDAQLFLEFKWPLK